MASYEAYLCVGIDASGAQAGANQFAGATDKVAASAKKAADANAKFEQQIKQATLMLKFFATAAATITIRSISEYTYAMSSVQAVTKATADDMVQLERITRELGATTQFTAAQAAEGAKFLGMAGFTANQILEALPATLDLAAAATLSMGQAADITSNIMSGFGLAANQAGRAADVLAAIAASANTDVTGMGSAMKYVGPISRSLGISMEDTAAAVGVLANQGIQGSMAGTGLKTSFSALVGPTKAAKEAIKSLGLDLKDVNPQFNSLEDVIKRFADAGLDAERAFTIFGQRGATAMLALTGDIPGLEKLIKVTNDATGSAARMAKIMNDNVRGDALLLTSALTNLTFIIGDAGLTKAVRSYLQEATKMADSFSSMLSSLIKNREQAQLLADALNVVKNVIISIMALKFAEWLFVAGNAMRLLNLAMSANPWVLAATGAITLGLHLKDLHGETSRLTSETDKQTEALKKMGDMGSQAGLKMQKSFLEARKLALMGAETIESLNKQIEEREKQRALRAEVTAKVGMMKDRTDPGTAAIAGGFSDPVLADLYARRLEIQNVEKELKNLERKQQEAASGAFKIGRQWGRALVDGIQSIDKKDIANFLSAYVPGVKTMMGFETPVVPSDDISAPKKEPFMEGELRNMKLAVELAKNLGAAESELYRIRLNAQALQDARENKQKGISATAQKQIEQAVALRAEEERLTTVYEAKKGLDDNLKARLKTAMEAVSVAQNMGASEADLLRMQLESQASEAARKMGLQGINTEMQTMIDKIVALTGLAADYKKAFEDDKQKKEYLQGLKDQLAEEQKRAELMKQYKGNIAEVDTQMKIYNETKQKKIDLTAEEIKQAAENVNAEKKIAAQTAATAEAAKKAAESQKQWNNQLTYSFKDAIMNSKNLGDALSNLTNRVQDMLVNKALDNLLGGLMGGFAKGAAFQAGGVTAFASGGVVNSPTMFPMRGGVGLMGEAGAEAIMPLTRTSNGDLGVKAVGTGGVVIAPQITVNVSGGTKEQNDDAGKKVSAAVRQAIDDTVVSVIMREKRPGGVLNAA